MHPYPDPESAAQACCDYILAAAAAAKALRKIASIAVSGGSTPKLLFRAMAAQTFDWKDVHLFFVDERCVPPSSDQSNFRLANENFLMPVQFPLAQVHRIDGEIDPEQSAREYAADLEAFFQSDSPRFDVIQHGLGTDAHTASLFPGEPLIYDQQMLTAAVFSENAQQWRITLMPRVIRQARHTAFLVCGADKSEALANVFGEVRDPLRYPAQIAALDGAEREIAWFVDEDAATDYLVKRK